MSEVIKMNINGRAYTLKEGRDFEVTETLSTVLRERLGFTGVRVSCNQGACGACTILLNGRSALSCMMLAVEADGCDITTIEGLPADDPVIKAFAEESDPGYGTAMQCGFCTPGFVLETKSLLAENPNPTPEEIREGLSGHVCRCGVYQGIEHAVEKVSKALYEAGGGQASDDKSEESAAAVPGGACSCQNPGGAGGGQASDDKSEESAAAVPGGACSCQDPGGVCGGQASDDISEESGTAVPGGACSCQDPGEACSGKASDEAGTNAGEEV